ncbi:MAG TPA: SBBP repeat-containing protein, partial [Anaerolineae bacterium]|nr:SBBP repeat-containing protein [Anaerolineae bacterium]
MSTPRLTLCLVLVLALLAPGASASLAQPADSPAAPASPAAPGAMLIVENAGQWPAAARFQVWNSPLGAGTTWLAEDGIWLVVSRQVDKDQVDKDGRSSCDDPLVSLSTCLPVYSSHALKFTFPGSNPDVRIEPFGAVDTTVSYFIGDNPDLWHPAVPVWGGVRYVGLYPGIDLVLGATGAQLVAHPSADLDTVALRVEGADAATVDGDALRLSTAAGDVRMPLLYVDVAPAGSALVQARGQEAFEVDAPFASHSLQGVSRAPADDPGDLLYSTFLGGSSNDNGYAIAVDGAGSAYVAGQSYSDNFPTTPGAYDPSQNGNEDAFVVKLNPAGSGLAYATFMGGSDRD